MFDHSSIGMRCPLRNMSSSSDDLRKHSPMSTLLLSNRSGKMSTKKGSMFAWMTLHSIPKETIISPHILEFLEQALEAIPVYTAVNEAGVVERRRGHRQRLQFRRTAVDGRVGNHGHRRGLVNRELLTWSYTATSNRSHSVFLVCLCRASSAFSGYRRSISSSHRSALCSLRTTLSELRFPRGLYGSSEPQSKASAT